MKRWRPRARGRATRIRKRTCHITVIVSRLPADQLELRRRRMEAVSANRSRRVDASRRRADLSGRLTESFSGVRVVKAYGAERREALVFAKGAHRLFRNVAATITGFSMIGAGRLRRREHRTRPALRKFRSRLGAF